MKNITQIVLIFLLGNYPQALLACSCGNYFSSKPKPNWVDTQFATANDLSTYGITQCTGIKTLDLKRAANSAKEAMSQLISVEVSTVTQTKTHTRSAASSNQFTQSSKLEAHALLEEATFIDNWVDKTNCVVYRQLTLPKQSILKAKSKLKAEYSARFDQQTFYLNTTGEHATIAHNMILAQLSKLGLNFTSEPQQATVAINIKVNTEHSSSKKLLAVMSVDITKIKSSKQVLFQVYDGKGISFQPESTNTLKKRAFLDAADRLSMALKQSYLDKKI